MFARRNNVGFMLLAITGILLLGAVAVLSQPAFAATTNGGKPGGTEYGSEVGLKAVPDQGKAVGSRKALPGHGGFCSLKGKLEAQSMGVGRGQVGMKTSLPGHGGFLVPGEEC